MKHSDEAVVELGAGRRFTAFEGTRRIGGGELPAVAVKVREAMARGGRSGVLVFDDVTSEQVELDVRGSLAEVRARAVERAAAMVAATTPVPEGEGLPRGRGRPKLGVVAREVTLLPRHWAWLGEQPGGASVALRRLVDAARKANEGKDRLRRAQDAAYRFMSAMAGNFPGFEEAVRALFGGDAARFEELVAAWPAGVRDHATKLAGRVFQ
jgi:hypothetical protein